MTSDDLTWRPMTPQDLDGVADVAAMAFPDHREQRACFANRLELNPDGCFVLTTSNGPVMGYLIAYPWRRHAAPPLNTLFEALPDDAEVVYLHDLALHSDARGGGRTYAIVERLAADARAAGWPAITLVAVNDAREFWTRQGFKAENPPGMAEKLSSYGADACYMVRSLKSGECERLRSGGRGRPLISRLVQAFRVAIII